MSQTISLRTARIILSLIAVLTIVSPYIADWNVTHIYDPRWPPHGRYHNAQTMVLTVLLGLAAIGFISRTGTGSASELLTGLVLAALYWVSQAFAFLFPGGAWTDPDLLWCGVSALPGHAIYARHDERRRQARALDNDRYLGLSWISVAEHLARLFAR